MSEKRCTKCGVIKPLSGFHKHRLSKDGHAYQCKECNKTRSRAWSKTPSGIYSVISGRVNFRNKLKKYHQLHIKKGEFIEWYNAQEKVCVYCGINEEELQTLPDEFNNNSRRLTIDCKSGDLGYALENIVLACWRCNLIKGDLLSYEEMKYIGENFIKPKWEKLRGKANE